MQLHVHQPKRRVGGLMNLVSVSGVRAGRNAANREWRPGPSGLRCINTRTTNDKEEI